MFSGARSPFDRDQGVSIARASPRGTPKLAVRALGGGILVGLDLGAAIEDLRAALGEILVELDHFRLHFLARRGLELEVVKAVNAANEGGAVGAVKLANGRRDVADREADAAIVGRIRPRPMHEEHVVQRRLAGLELEVDRRSEE